MVFEEGFCAMLFSLDLPCTCGNVFMCRSSKTPLLDLHMLPPLDPYGDIHR